MRVISPLSILLFASGFAGVVLADKLQINDKGYFSKPGLNVMVFSDIYPDGHQTGVTVIQHGVRVAANGDLRLEASPGQWSPVPRGIRIDVDKATQTITQTLAYPDPDKNQKGFNPITYPDLDFSYRVSVSALSGNSFKITVDLDKPLPSAWVGKVGFNFELFPGHLFGKSWLLDDQAGIFAMQPNGPLQQSDDEQWLTTPLATGKKLIVAPGAEKQRFKIEAEKGELTLLDGRSNHNNGWYIVRTMVPAGATENAIEWIVTPHTVPDWQYKPAIQVSQLGYTPQQPKQVILEQDSRDDKASPVTIYRLTEQGAQQVEQGDASPWGEFLRYRYFTYDFSHITQAGLYQVEYRGERSHAFEIATDIYSRNAWQPTLEYYLPVQMCHMRVNEKYRVWHGHCHHDDALMAPVDTNHFDGYISGSSTLTKFKPFEPVPGLNRGGWHDAGDYDLRVESQTGTVWRLATMVEEFNVNYDATAIDQNKQVVEIHQPDGHNDMIQQIEHGLLSVLGGYESLGRLYRGIIVPTIRQYVLLGDASVQTNNKTYQGDNPAEEADDRWVFTEQNPDRELYVAAGLAAASRVLEKDNPQLAKRALDAAQAIYTAAGDKKVNVENRAFALAELILTTGDGAYKDELVSLQAEITADIAKTGWSIGRVKPHVSNRTFWQAVDKAVTAYQHKINAESTETPYGVPYKPHIWGAGWGIQAFGVKQYFFHKTWPNQTGTEEFVNALNFVLGVHPGENTMSFASGVGANSALVAYGVNRADWSYIPGGVISGTALIQPDLPELKVWPFFWQQTEYVMGGGATNYMFLVLAVDELYRESQTAPGP